jgi:hypothetical protein
MDNFFSSPDLFDNTTKQEINSCGTVLPKRKGMPLDLLPPNRRLKRGDIQFKTRDDFMAMVCREKCNMY